MPNLQLKIPFLILILGFIAGSCGYTKLVERNEYLLHKNKIRLHAQKGALKKGELKENLENLVFQKTNTYFLGIPFKLLLYQSQRGKFVDLPKDSSIGKSYERPVIFDSLMMHHTREVMKSYLFNQGYFFVDVIDSCKLKGKKATAIYNVNTGTSYIVGKTILDVDDSVIKHVVDASLHETFLKNGESFYMGLLEQERSRLTNVLKNSGYYKFSQENIVDFNIDTFSKEVVMEGFKKNNKALDIKITIRKETPDAYKIYRVNSVDVYPDFLGSVDIENSKLFTTSANNAQFHYHNYYIKEKVISKQIILEHNKVFAQSDFDVSLNKLNQLNVFQTVRIVIIDDTIHSNENEGRINVLVLLTPSKKYDFTSSFEVSTGTTYFLGATPTISLHDRNLGKGANQFTASISGGIETFYDQTRGNTFFDHINVLTKNLGFSTSWELPKFLSPISVDATKRNLPRTTLNLGSSFIDRTNFFTLTNTSSSITYKWRETSKKSWELTPAFINIIRRPSTSSDFQARLDTNAFLANSYRENFIQGENLSYLFSSQMDNKGRSYSYLHFSVEEAGTLMKFTDEISKSNFPYGQYVKLDFDARRYIIKPKSQLAFRFYGGMGIPNGNATALPYIKQYFVGGAYSIRGWRIRSLGPGSFYDAQFANDTAKPTSSIYIDRTGDIKLEMNGEYRFNMMQFFGGTIKMTGALFADAGNIWLANKVENYPNGEFDFGRLGNDIAISTGAGARFNLAGFFIFRIDASFPVKKHYSELYHYGGWVIDRIKFSDNNWRANNLVINFAIGYPF
jgi:outer membrane protein assembly factor BamA